MDPYPRSEEVPPARRRRELPRRRGRDHGDYGPNNFYVYRFANTTQYQLPWDKSNTFWGTPTTPYSANINDGPEDHRNHLVVRALRDTELRELYLSTLLEGSRRRDGHARAAPERRPGDERVARGRNQLRVLPDPAGRHHRSGEGPRRRAVRGGSATSCAPSRSSGATKCGDRSRPIAPRAASGSRRGLRPPRRRDSFPIASRRLVS